jgi:competence ComEA-like helix-hairpin-helix protein
VHLDMTSNSWPSNCQSRPIHESTRTTLTNRPNSCELVERSLLLSGSPDETTRNVRGIVTVNTETKPIGSRFFSRARLFLSPLLLLMLVLASLACVKRPRVMFSASQPNQQTSQSVQTKADDQQSLSPQTKSAESAQRININTARANELETLPGIGKGLAERIIEHRARYGPFRRTEHLIIVRGISDKRFRALRELITVE